MPSSRAEQTGAAWVLYGALMRLLALPMLLRLWWRGRAEPLYREALAERLGYYRGDSSEPGRVWLHAVSLGETRAASALIDALRRHQPGLRLLLTHGTATGREAGRALLQPGDAQAWLPWDSPGAVRRFLAHHRPAVGVLMETEVWPALLLAARAAGVPVVLANARLSAKSRRQALRLAPLIRPALQSIEQVMAQTEPDAARLREVGAEQVAVCGNLKFDMTPDADLLARGRAWRLGLARPVVMAASTREGEEAPLLAAWRAAMERRPTASPRPLLLVVPRHPQRFDEVFALFQAAGLSVARRSTWDDGEGAQPPAEAQDADIWLGDSIGELPLYYALADVALLGGSFAPLGGQNLIEAAACGCPLLMGPSTFNFADAAGLAEAAGAATRVADLPDAVSGALGLLASEPARRAQSQFALSFAAAHRGAADRMASAIVGLLTGANAAAVPVQRRSS